MVPPHDVEADPRDAHRCHEPFERTHRGLAVALPAPGPLDHEVVHERRFSTAFLASLEPDHPDGLGARIRADREEVLAGRGETVRQQARVVRLRERERVLGFAIACLHVRRGVGFDRARAIAIEFGACHRD